MEELPTHESLIHTLKKEVIRCQWLTWSGVSSGEGIAVGGVWPGRRRSSKAPGVGVPGEELCVRPHAGLQAVDPQRESDLRGRTAKSQRTQPEDGLLLDRQSEVVMTSMRLSCLSSRRTNTELKVLQSKCSFSVGNGCVIVHTGIFKMKTRKDKTEELRLCAHCRKMLKHWDTEQSQSGG